MKCVEIAWDDPNKRRALLCECRYIMAIDREFDNKEYNCACGCTWIIKKLCLNKDSNHFEYEGKLIL